MQTHVSFLLLLVISTNAFKTPSHRRQLLRSVDPDTPLILTPYLKDDRIEEAQSYSEVHHEDFGKLTSFSGYLTVDEAFNSNLFFWFFPNENKNAPLLLWLEGGQGISTLYGLFHVNGPLMMKNMKVTQRNVSWTQTHSVLYIDSPVGTGFGFTEGGYARNQTIIGRHLYEAVVQFLQLFPEYLNNAFYVTGHSYAGKYVPALGYTILKNNPTRELKVNLQGLAIGNGFSDPIHQCQYSDFLYDLGLLDSNGRSAFKRIEEETFGYIQAEKWSDAYETLSILLGDTADSNQSLYSKLTGLTNNLNVFTGDQFTDDELADVEEFVQRPDVRRALHVGNTSFSLFDFTVSTELQDDFFQSVAPWVVELLEHYPLLLYTGHLDVVVNYPMVVNYLNHLDFRGAEECRNSSRKLWYVEGRLAGYVKTGGNLTEVLVRNAGHVVPVDQPSWALDLITRFTHKLGF